jgi:hypothetical protein
MKKALYKCIASSSGRQLICRHVKLLALLVLCGHHGAVNAVLATTHAPRLPQLHDVEEDVSEGNGVAYMNVLSDDDDDDDDDFDLVQQLPAPAGAKRKRPQKLAGGRKQSRK